MVHPGRILSDPTNTARHYYVLEPLLSDRILFQPKRKRFNEMLETAIKISNNERIIAGVKPYYNINVKVRDSMEKLNAKHLMFITGISPNWATENSRTHGSDYFSVSNKLGEEIMKIMFELRENINLEDWKLIPITPFIGGLEFLFNEDHKFITRHTHYQEIETISSIGGANKKLGLSSTERKLREYKLKKNLYKFGEFLYDSTLAKRVLEIPPWRDKESFHKELEECTNFNKHLLAIVYSKLINELDFPFRDREKVIDIFSSKSSYAYKVIELACKYNGNARISDWSLFKDIKKPFERECNSTVLNRFKTRIQNRSEEFKKQYAGVKDDLSDLL